MIMTVTAEQKEAPLNLLLPYQRADFEGIFRAMDESKSAIDILLTAAGYLDCAARQMLPQFLSEHRRDMPVDLARGVLTFESTLPSTT